MTARPPLFTTGIAIKDFRGYGTFTIELPPRPCVVLLSGPNGLGKTSLFEALEWGLTGSVKRLDTICRGTANPRDLARHAPNVDSFSVEIAFQDGDGREERVSRTQLIANTPSAPPADVGTSPDDVAKLLSSGDPRWSVSGKNLAEYLHLTHLHAQVASLRLVTSDAKERWVRVSPLAGADRFERVRTNLTNSKRELTRLIDRRTQDLDTAVAKRQHWTDLLVRLNQLQKIAGTVHDLLSPSDVSKEINVLRMRLALGAPGDAPGPEDDVGSSSEHLRNLRIDIEAAGSAVKRKLGIVDLLRALPQQLADARTEHSAAAERTTAMVTERDLVRARLSVLEETTKERRAAYEDAFRKQKEAASEHELTVRAQRDRTDLAPFERELAEAEEQLRAARQKLEEVDGELRRRRDDLTAHASRLRVRDRAQEQLAASDLAFAALNEVEALQKRLREDHTKREELTTALQKLDAELESAAAEGRARDDIVAAATGEIESLRQVFDTLQRALLAIAGHLRDEDTQCPVCQTQFEHAELRSLAQRALGSRDPKIAELMERLRAAKAGREEVRKQQAQRALERRKVDADLRALKENIAQLESRIASLRKDPFLAERGNDEARLELTRARSALAADVDRTGRELAAGASGDELKRAVLDGTTASETQKRLYAIAQERRNGRQTRLEQLRARIAQVQSEHPELGDGQALNLNVQAKAAAASSAKDATDLASMRVANAQAAESAMRQTLVARETEVAKLSAQVESLASTLHAHEKRWRDAGLPDPISERNLDAAVEKLGHRNREMDEALQAIVALASALDRWRLADDLHAAEAEVRQECGAREHGAYALELAEAVRAAAAAATIAQRAREASDQLSATLNKVTTEFGGRALRPFDELFRRYLRALIQDERFHNIETTYMPAARAAGLSFKVGLDGVDSEAENILSEGQLGEVSLATMLAASSAFPWSRWRVLLLDDPTQYNDLIHSTALFDVLRNLVRFARFQIFVSTHDNEQAAFLRRKLDAIDTPWIECRYVAHSPGGIVAEVRRSFETSASGMASRG